MVADLLTGSKGDDLGGGRGASGDVRREKGAGYGDVEGGNRRVGGEGGKEEIHLRAAVHQGPQVALELPGVPALGGEGGGDNAEEGLVAGDAVTVAAAADLVVRVRPRVAEGGVGGGEGGGVSDAPAARSAAREVLRLEETEQREAEAMSEVNGEGEIVEEDVGGEGVEEEEGGLSDRPRILPSAVGCLQGCARKVGLSDFNRASEAVILVT